MNHWTADYDGIPADLEHPWPEYGEDEAEDGDQDEDQAETKAVGYFPPHVVASVPPELRKRYGIKPFPGASRQADEQEQEAQNVGKTGIEAGKGANADMQESRKRQQTSADFAEEYLRVRQYEVNGQYTLRQQHGQWLRYNGVYYEPLDDKELKADITNYFTGTDLRSRVNKSFVLGVIDHIAAKCLIPSSISLPAFKAEGAWHSEPETVTLQNGLINITSVHIALIPRLQQHAPGCVSRCALPYDYKPDATCPAWQTFLEEILPDEASRRLLQQIFGYCLTFDLRYQKFFMFEGTGGNGKSVVTSILRRLVGIHNVSSLPLSRFNDKHGLVSTFGKLVNITGELREKDKFAEDLLKQATGGDPMTFEPKYKEAFSAPFTAKIILCTNERPAFTDRSNGVWRRLIVLPFPISIPPDKQDPDLEERLAAELPGVLNWAVQGAIALHKAGQFEEPQASKEALSSFKEQANPALGFFNECCRLDPKASIGTRTLYRRYKEDMQDRGYKHMNEGNFTKEVLSLRGVEKGRTLQGGSYVHIYRGISLAVSPATSPAAHGGHNPSYM